jgi:hypothetical protein
MIASQEVWQQAGTIWMVDLDEPHPPIAPLVQASFRRAGMEDAPALAGSMGSSTLVDVYTRFETGRSCYLACSAGQLAAYGWASFEEEYIGEMGLRLRLLPGEAYIWDCATLPAFRQKRLFSALLVYILHELRSSSVCRAWIGANQENVASQRGIARAGFHSVADLVITHGPTRRLVFIKSHPGAPESLVAEARRVFLGDIQENKSTTPPITGNDQDER